MSVEKNALELGGTLVEKVEEVVAARDQGDPLPQSHLAPRQPLAEPHDAVVPEPNSVLSRSTLAAGADAHTPEAGLLGVGDEVLRQQYRHEPASFKPGLHSHVEHVQAVVLTGVEEDVGNDSAVVTKQQEPVASGPAQYPEQDTAGQPAAEPARLPVKDAPLARVANLLQDIRARRSVAVVARMQTEESFGVVHGHRRPLFSYRAYSR